MDHPTFFRLTNLAAAGLMVFGGIAQFFSLSLQSIIIGIYVILFAVATTLLEVQHTPHPIMVRHASFMFSLVGRGVFYVFVGCILIHDFVLTKIAGSLVGFVGICYVVLEFVPSVEPPENMRSSEWDGEQV